MYLFLILLSLLTGCSCDRGGLRGPMKIGIDPTWYPIDFGPQTSYVNGYIEDLLLEMALYSGMEFELVQANWDALREGLKRGKFDAILTSMPLYDYHQESYESSDNALNLGPVLIGPAGGEALDLKKMGGQLVGTVANSPAVLVLEKYPDLILRGYPTVPALLNAVVAGEIQAAVLDRIPAVNFVKDLYAGKLKIVSQPLTDGGLHLVARKGRLQSFNDTLRVFEKKKKMDPLLEKWSLK